MIHGECLTEEETILMSELSSSVSPKGQVTIPMEIRRRFGIKPRDVVRFQVVNGEIKLVREEATLETAFGSVPALARPMAWSEVEQIAWDEQAAHVAAEMREE